MKLLVHSQKEENGWKFPEEDHSLDLLVIFKFFTTRNNGRIAAKNKTRKAKERTRSTQEEAQDIV
jgi:hypothetical protein